MQSHAGEHILSGVVHALFGYDNVGFHMSEKTMTVDFSGVLTQTDLEAVEAKANEAVWNNVPITVSYPSEEEAAAIDYRSKIEYREGLRLVTIEGVDCCACCAPHPSRSGEIGLIKILDFCPNKGGTRVEMVAGRNAFDDYAALNRMNKALMGLLSAKRDGVQAAVEKQNETAGALKSETVKLSRRLAMSELVPTFVGKSFFASADGLSFDDLRYCANELTASHADCGICLLFSRDGEGQVLYVAASPKGDVRGAVAELNKAFDGKGGGKPVYAQGKLASAENEELLHAAVKELLARAE
jgi:alanyl-tRNA synthetase